MYEYEEVPDAEAKAYAQSINAIFQTTSAKVSSGIDELFKMIGEKFLHPTNGGGSVSKDNSPNKNAGGVNLNNKKEGKKKGCC